jgi:hypothetical protein
MSRPARHGRGPAARPISTRAHGPRHYSLPITRYASAPHSDQDDNSASYPNIYDIARCQRMNCALVRHRCSPAVTVSQKRSPHAAATASCTGANDCTRHFPATSSDRRPTASAWRPPPWHARCSRSARRCDDAVPSGAGQDGTMKATKLSREETCTRLVAGAPTSEERCGAAVPGWRTTVQCRRAELTWVREDPEERCGAAVPGWRTTVQCRRAELTWVRGRPRAELTWVRGRPGYGEDPYAQPAALRAARHERAIGAPRHAGALRSPTPFARSIAAIRRPRRSSSEG